MKITILTLFPEMFVGPFDHSIIKRAREKNLVDIKILNIRDFATDRHKTVDDRPYGGGAGMILRVDILDRAIQSSTFVPSSGRGKLKVKSLNLRERIILLDPGGKVFNQKMAKRLSKFNHLILVCGHYEGVDERARNLVDEEISIGNYVLTGGEIPTMVFVDAVIRLLPQVLEKPQASQEESFSNNRQLLLEYPQYTRPKKYKDWVVPKVLLSGNHQEIARWRREVALKRTKKRRPDLFKD